MGFILGVLMALCLASAAPDFQTRRIRSINDRTIDILPSPIPDSSHDVEAKLQRPHVNIIEDEFDERGVIGGINWLGKLRSELIDFLRHKNSELEKKVEGVDPPRHRKDISGSEEEEEKEKKEEKKEKRRTTLEPSAARKVQNNETRPKDQEQMIRIELPAGVHTGKSAKLFHTNDKGFVNTVEGNFAANKSPINKESREKPRPRFNRRDVEAKERKVHTDTFPPTPNSRGRRDAEEPLTERRTEFEKITLQFKHLPDSQKTKFCSYLKRDLVGEPLQMLMALLGKVHSESSDEGSIDNWDRTRSTELSKTEDKKGRQKLVLKWGCEDWIRGQDRIQRAGSRSMGISRSLTDDRESGSLRSVKFPLREGRDSILEVRLGSSGRGVSEETRGTVISAHDRQQDGFVLSLKLSGDNRVTKQVRVIIDMDEDTRDYQN